MPVGTASLNAVRSVAVATAAGLTTASALWMTKHRMSPIVRAWSASQHPPVASSGLAVRRFGAGPETIVLLHGLGATSRYWPASYDGLGAHSLVLAPDLLGFGGSLDEQRTSFSLDDHLVALDDCLAEHAPGAGPITLVAHSMGSLVALQWAQRLGGRVRQVICAGAPVYRSAGEAGAAFTDAGPMADLFLRDTRWAERACAVSCRQRAVAGVAAAMIEPQMPVPIARAATLHTWPAYRQSIHDLILEVDWEAAFAGLSDRETEIDLLWGTNDEVGDRRYARELATDRPRWRLHAVSGADHHLPITHPHAIIARVRSYPGERSRHYDAAVNR